MYARLPTAKELDGTGLALADYEEEAEVWPENWPIFELFASLDTQWATDMNGRIGLRYEALYPLLDRRYPGEAWEEAFAELQLLERTALAALRD